MNILQLEDQIKGLPDQQLMQEAKAPTGQMPQYLLISEVQRRADMRKRYEAQQPQNEGTISDQIMNGGIGSLQQQGQQHPPVGFGETDPAAQMQQQMGQMQPQRQGQMPPRGMPPVGFGETDPAAQMQQGMPVSYTHLTLPTILLV